MTKEQFEALKDWTDFRASTLASMASRPNDMGFIRARERELREADERAEEILVDQREPEANADH